MLLGGGGGANDAFVVPVHEPHHPSSELFNSVSVAFSGPICPSHTTGPAVPGMLHTLTESPMRQ